MIFVTIGSMFPFDRLIRVMDQWASANSSQELFAQIGNGSYEPRHMPWTRMVAPSEFEQRVSSASLIVAHAGMGSVITAMEKGKPIILLPRRAADREHTTDHQLHTAVWLKGKAGIEVAMSDQELLDAVTQAVSRKADSGSLDRISKSAPERFTSRIREFVTASSKS